MKNLKLIGFKEDPEIIELLDNVTRNKGINRSDFIRESVRKRLAELSFFSEDTKKCLGVANHG